MTAMRICSLLWTILGLVWLIAWLRTKRTQERAPFSSRLLYGVPVFIAFYLLLSDNVPAGWLQSRIIPQNVFVAALAVTLTALGIAFAIWALLHRTKLEQRRNHQSRTRTHPHRPLRLGPPPNLFRPLARHHWHSVSPPRTSRPLRHHPPMAGILDQKPNGRTIHAQNLRPRLRRLRPFHRRTSSPSPALTMHRTRLERVGAEPALSEVHGCPHLPHHKRWRRPMSPMHRTHSRPQTTTRPSPQAAKRRKITAQGASPG
jgi:hypothetical protein